MLSSNEKSKKSSHAEQSCSSGDSQISATSGKQNSVNKQSQTTKSTASQNALPKKAPLFREEAVQAQGTRLDGDVLISHTLTNRNFALFYLIVSILIVGFLYFGTYTRKVTVVGFLEPETGLSKVYPINTGRISDLLVNEGDSVKKGDRLANIIVDSVSDNGGYGFKQIASEIEQSITILRRQHKSAIEEYAIEERHLEHDIASIQDLLSSLIKQKLHLTSKNEIVLRKLDSLQMLQKKGSISMDDYNIEKIKALDSALSIDEIRILISEARHDLATAKLNLEQLPLKRAMSFGEIDQKISDLRRQLIDANMHHAYTIEAPIDGRVSALTYRVGDKVAPGFPLLSVMPEQSEMQAKIYLPSSSISFIHEGQAINIQYQALPVQRFGTYPGKIVHISTTPVNPNDFQTSPLTFDQPMYLVTAEVYDQSIDLEDSTFPIVAGMAINISLLAEEQTILEWLIDPFWEIKGRIQ